MNLDESVWDHSTFTRNRDRLLNETVARRFFEEVVKLAEWKGLMSSEHFTVDGTLIEAWASQKRFRARDGSDKAPEGGKKNPTVDFKGTKRSNETHASTTDPEARRYKKRKGDKSSLCYLGHALMENRNGRVVDGPRQVARQNVKRRK